MASGIPELPHDKTSHLFVCYEEKSLEFVRTIVDNLEEKGVKCCFGHRDFRIGRNIIGNIYESIRKSLFMLIVLSEEFQDSPYCLHETEEAISMKLTGEYDVIPIRIEPCTLPECLQHLLYIDVDDKDTIHNKVIDAMTNKDLRIDFREDKNGEDSQTKLEIYRTNWLFSFIRYRLLFTETQRAKIWGDKFEVPADLLHEIEDTVNCSSFMKYGYICTPPQSFVILFFVFLCLLILMTIVYLILKVSGTDEETFLIYGLLSFGLVLAIVIGIIKAQHDSGAGFYAVYLKTLRVLQDELWDISKKNKKRTGMVFFFEQKKEKVFPNRDVIFHIMRFNFKPCEDYFTRRLNERKFLRKFCKENESDQEYTSRIFNTYMRKNCDKLSIASTTHRHTMKNSSKCVCLLVEEWLKNMY